jgi:hypothetical protein
MSTSSPSPIDVLKVMDDFDLEIMLLLLQVMQASMHVITTKILVAMGHVKQESTSREKPFVSPRKTFHALSGSLPSIQFRRTFRMHKDSFLKLSDLIESSVGQAVFKSEEWLCSSAPSQEKKKAVSNLGTDALGGILSGELKLAITIRLLAGASYLDVLMIFGISKTSLYNVFHEVNVWIVKTLKFPLTDWIVKKNEEALNHLSEAFSEASGGIFRKCIGALDGIAIKIKAPSYSNIIPDPGNYFCRKGFFALNVQAICDKRRRVIWMSTGHKGSTHDSMAFLDTQLIKVLEENSAWLDEKGYFIVGDSAYPLYCFLLVPFADAAPQSPEDAFNFWLSNSRINIECTFGEIIMRWGIFWRKLLFNIEDVGNVITAAALLHNFLVDERELDAGLNAEEVHYFSTFSLREQDDRANTSTEAPAAVATDNNEPHPGGRPVINQQLLGKRRRDQITQYLYGCGRGRANNGDTNYNQYGQVYFS